MEIESESPKQYTAADFKDVTWEAKLKLNQKRWISFYAISLLVVIVGTVLITTAMVGGAVAPPPSPAPALVAFTEDELVEQRLSQPTLFKGVLSLQANLTQLREEGDLEAFVASARDTLESVIGTDYNLTMELVPQDAMPSLAIFDYELSDVPFGDTHVIDANVRWLNSQAELTLMIDNTTYPVSPIPMPKADAVDVTRDIVLDWNAVEDMVEPDLDPADMRPQDGEEEDLGNLLTAPNLASSEPAITPGSLSEDFEVAETGRRLLRENPFKGYSHDSSLNIVNTRWMAKLPDNRKLSDLSIPGTHDTASDSGLHGGHMAQCQTLGLAEQLKSGIRYFDFRLRRNKDGRTMDFYHGISNQHMTFASAINILNNFLKLNPSETVIMAVQPENDKKEHAGAFTQYFTGHFDQMGKYLYKDPMWAKKKYQYETANPTLGELRGKYIIITKYFSHCTPHGTGGRYTEDSPGVCRKQLGLYANVASQAEEQNDFGLKNNWHLYEKWNNVKAFFLKTSQKPKANVLYCNYLSASGGSFPYFVASGKSSPQTGAAQLRTGLTTVFGRNKNKWVDFPRVSCFWRTCSIAFKGINMLSLDLLKSGQVKHAGVVIMDFPGPELIKAIIALNKPAGFTGTTGQLYRNFWGF